MKKFIGITVFIIVLALSGFIYFRFYRPFAKGVKSGVLNYLTEKGYIFKTYEGKLIQSGLRSRQPGSVQSYEFEFSVEKENIAKQLMNNSGKEFDLHYTEYIGRLPWRGYTAFIVDSIYSMRDVRQ